MKSRKSRKPRSTRKEPASTRLEKLVRSLPPDEWRARAESLQRDLAAETPASDVIELTHEECEEMLAWYASDEQAGKNVRELYPPVYHHLQTCARCAQSYALLGKIMSEGEAVPNTATAAELGPLPFLQANSGKAWYQEAASQLLGAVQRVSFLFNPVYLQRFFSGGTALAVMSGEDIPAESLLLADRVTIGEQPVDVVAFQIAYPDEPGRFCIHLRVSSPLRLKTPLRARLNWGDQEYVADLTTGEGDLERISPPDFTQPVPDEPSRKFRLTLEPVPDEPSGAD